MGEVYRARDSSLGRFIAIKILPDTVAGDAERLARFEREARSLAALNHPNIAQVHGFEGAEVAGAPVRALVMELVEGEDLAERIKRGRLPIADALAIARQIVDALEAAHAQGIVHRDLKSANIRVRSDGVVKLLDFGLAKAAGAADDVSAAVLENSPTISSPAATARGVILGTAASMAPEQATGKPVDKRVDVWAFGVVLYEMGRTPAVRGRRRDLGAGPGPRARARLERAPGRHSRQRSSLAGPLPAEGPPIPPAGLRRCAARD